MNPLRNYIPNCDNEWYYDEEYKFHCLNNQNSYDNNNMLFIESNR